MFKREIVFNDILDKLPEKAGRYLCITEGFLNSDFELLRFTKTTKDLIVFVDEDKDKKNVWYYSDDEWGDVIVDRVLYWAESPKINLVG